ncbi:hypothetical protein GCM10011326_20680 [Salipiger profundus]|nr:hypothetical protein GCM10011326_20680 [Salipiger profundus]
MACVRCNASMAFGTSRATIRRSSDMSDMGRAPFPSGSGSLAARAASRQASGPARGRIGPENPAREGAKGRVERQGGRVSRGPNL